jgi:SNF2 family DNA or RNA helicase
MSKQPRQYQQIAIDRAVRRNLLLADRCGLGKTITAIGVAKQACGNILIVVPNAIKLQWLRELIDAEIPRETIHWIDSKDTIVDILSIDAPCYVLTHYEALVKHIDTFSKVKWALVIADEAHRIKNRDTKRAKALKKLHTTQKLALTGTPFDRDPSQIWSILNWLEPQFFSSYWRFYEAHINWRMQPISYNKSIKVIDPNKPLRDPDAFARTLRPFMLQRSKQEVRSDLPERIDQYIDLEMLPEQAKAYAKIINCNDPIVIFDELNEATIQIALTRILRLIQMTTDPTLLGVNAASAKLEWLNEWLEDNPNESVIIFTRFRATAEKLHKQLDGFKLIVGGNRAVVDPSVTRIVGTISAMGEGLDLPYIDNAIFIDCEWSSILMTQAIDRIHRINISNAKNVYFLRCVATADELMIDTVRNKWSTREMVEQYLKGNNNHANQIHKWT